jgi:hypothetical protein
MITPEDARIIDPSLTHYTDEELKKILHTLYGLGELALESYMHVSKNRRRVSGLNDADMRK